MLKILVTGSNGLLGQKLIYALKAKRPAIEVAGIARGKNRLKNKDGYTFFSVNLTDKDAVSEIIQKFKPDCIIHTAAMTNVDTCELNPEECKKQNEDVVRYLVEACKPFGTHFIDISTDFVFDGTAGPYSEDANPNPLSVYGRSKLAAEKIVQESGLPWAILRTMIIYGVTDDTQRSNVVLWTKSSLEQGKDINVITDQFRGPTLAEDLADACIQATLRKSEGIFHVSGAEVMPIIDIAATVADFFGLDKKYIHPITTESLKQPAERPLKTGFIIEKARKELNFHPRTLKEGLAIVKYQLLQR
jgi:dTDP-4-dehydrorhamnose reductase